MLLFFLSEMLMLTVSGSNRSFSYFSNPAALPCTSMHVTCLVMVLPENRAPVKATV